MKNHFVRVLSLVTVVALFTCLLAPFSVAAKSSESSESLEEEKVKAAAEQIKFVAEEATIKDSNGNIIGLDIEKIEQKYGSSPVLEKIKKDQQATVQDIKNPKLDSQQCAFSSTFSTFSTSGVIMPIGFHDMEEFECVQDGFSSFFVDLVPTTVLTTAYQYFLDKNYTGTARALLKAGAKGSIWGIAGSLTWVALKCRITN
ncbi:hypothetical protein [Terribacillus sp. DMT04]|uniref:hypothetical protein n=1 Tax=Terribacillus sp. DMT04 TaxID=2850441 RepID=UPI001C2BA0D2|nr:hypothetical protein [Terribacillus sp. DMT04]QXE02775.1 hypothetical protein KS242_06240 [Terribacillus sp. DMT04]